MGLLDVDFDLAGRLLEDIIDGTGEQFYGLWTLDIGRVGERTLSEWAFGADIAGSTVCFALIIL